MSEHKHITVHHRGYRIKITYWIKERREKKIVSWKVCPPDRIDTLTDGYVRESLGGRPGIFGFLGRPERSFHEMIAEAVEESAAWINEHEQHLAVPEPDEITETLAIRGWDAEDKDIWE